MLNDLTLGEHSKGTVESAKMLGYVWRILKPGKQDQGRHYQEHLLSPD